MHVDIARDRSMVAALCSQTDRAGRRPWLRLLSEVLHLAGPEVEFLRHAERPWTSATFTGSRHTITLAFEGVAAVERGEAFIAALPDHEFAIPGQIAADATIVAVEHDGGAGSQTGPRMMVTAELLLLEAA